MCEAQLNSLHITAGTMTGQVHGHANLLLSRSSLPSSYDLGWVGGRRRISVSQYHSIIVPQYFRFRVLSELAYPYSNFTRGEKKKERGVGEMPQPVSACCKVFFTTFFFCALARTAPRVIGPLGTRGERRRKITSIRLIPVPFASSCVISLLYSALVKRGWFSSVPPFDSLIEGGGNMIKRLHHAS